MTRIIAINYDLAKAYGLNAAVTHQQIGWAVRHRESFDDTALGHEWLKCSLPELARIVPLSVRQVRTALDALEEADLVERRQVVEKGLGQTANEYRIKAFNGLGTPPVNPDRPPLSQRAAPPVTDDRPISNRRASGPKGGIQCPDGEPVAEERETLFGSEQAEPSRKSPDELFDQWWGKGREPGLYPKKAGSASQARSRFRKTLQKRSWSHIQTCTLNYLKAISMFELEHGIRPPILHGSTFLNADFRLDDWSEPWTPDRAAEFWAAAIPRNRNGSSLSDIDVDAFIREEEAARNG